MTAKKRFDDATFIFDENGSLYLHVCDRRNDAHASKRFSPSQALAIREWLFNTAHWEPDNTPLQGYATVVYDHATGYIRLHSRHGDSQYDASNDEALARLVRRLKFLAPVPRGELQDTLPNLPIPTPEQLANATRFKNPAIPAGYQGQALMKSRLQKPKASYEASKAKLADLRSMLVRKPA